MNIYKSYKSIIKEASLFSGVQIILLLVSMLKGMFIAKYLGVEATGIIGVLQTIVGFFIALFGLGLPVLLVRSFALNNNTNSILQQVVIKRLIVFLGLLGALVFYFLTPIFSGKLFNHDGYEWVLKAVAIVVFVKQLAVINTSILQGKQQLSMLAKVNSIIAVVGLFISIPLYYFFKVEGVIYGFIASFIVEVIVSHFALKRENKINSLSVDLKNYTTVLKEGFFLGYGNVLALLSQLIIIYYITYFAGTAQAGYYNAGFSIINNYVALIFVAMSTGYLPRLVKLLPNNLDLQEEIAKQLNFSIIVIGLLAIFCVLFTPFIVHTLFSEAFDVVIPFVKVAVFGMIFKTFSWCLGYLIIAKADTKVLAFTGVFFNVLFAIMLIAGFYFYNIIGVAFSFVVYNFFHLVGIWSITQFRYQIIIPLKTIILFVGVLVVNFVLLLL